MSERQKIRDRAERVEQWANLYGDDIAGQLRDEEDAEAVAVIDDALWCAHHCVELLSALEAAEADARQYREALERIADPNILDDRCVVIAEAALGRA